MLMKYFKEGAHMCSAAKRDQWGVDYDLIHHHVLDLIQHEEQILRWCIWPWVQTEATNPPVPFSLAELALLEYERTPALNDWGSAGTGFDLCDSLSAWLGVALIIPLLNSCFLAQLGSCLGIKHWAKS